MAGFSSVPHFSVFASVCFGKAPAYALATFQIVRVNDAGLLTRFVQALRICHQFNKLMLLLVQLWDCVADYEKWILGGARIHVH